MKKAPDAPSPRSRSTAKKAPASAPADGVDALAPRAAVHAQIATIVKPDIPAEFRDLALQVGDGTALAEKVRSGDAETFTEVASLFISERTMLYYGSIGHVLARIFNLRQHTGEPYTALIDALAEAFIQQDGSFPGEPSYPDDKWAGWSHSLCHLFEGYGKGDASFFDLASDLPAAEKLFLENAKRAIIQGNFGNSSRTTRAMQRYNLAHIEAENLDGAFPFRPMPPKQERFIALFDDKYSSDQRLLFAAKTPRTFLAGMVKMLHPLSTDPVHHVAQLAAIEGSVSAEELAAYLEKFGRVNGAAMSLEELRAGVNEAEEASETLPGTFVDVDGTLIVEGKLNAYVVAMITRRAKEGATVTVVTGGSPAGQTVILRSLGLDERFLPVQSKDTLRSKVVEELIDDTPAGYQGFRATRYVPPSRG